jgi:cell division protein FtsB
VGLREDLERLYGLAQAATRRYPCGVVENISLKEQRKKRKSQIDTMKTVTDNMRARVADLQSSLGAEILILLSRALW